MASPRTVTLGNASIYRRDGAWYHAALRNPEMHNFGGRLFAYWRDDKTPYDVIRAVNCMYSDNSTLRPTYKTLAECMTVQACFYEAMTEVKRACGVAFDGLQGG
jgi:hypothetical protein